MEIILTKKDLAGLHTTETTIATRENGEWEVWETVKYSPIDTEQLARIKAAIDIIACLEQDTKETLQYVSYVENGKLSKLTIPYNEPVPERLERLRGIFSKYTVKCETRTITVTKEDLERITLHNGLSMWEHPKTVENITGFTITDGDGYAHEFIIPEHLKWAVYSQPLDQRGVAMLLIAVRKLRELPVSTPITSVHVDAPGEEADGDVLTPHWLGVGWVAPITAEHLVKFLQAYTHALLPNCVVKPPIGVLLADATERIDLTSEDLNQIEFCGAATTSALTLKIGTRKEDDLGFSIRHDPLKLDNYVPRGENMWENIYDTVYEDRTYAVAYLVAAIAEEKKITGPVEIGDYPLESVASDIINHTRRQIDGKTPQQIQEQLSKLWYKK
nr:MAG TPA: hypothetical protein [Caudoviricetes sp.]